MASLRRLLWALLIGAGFAIVPPAPAEAQTPPDSTPRITYIFTTAGPGISVENGAWIEAPQVWRLLYEWTQWCMGQKGPSFDLIRFGLADRIYSDEGEWAGVTFKDSAENNRPTVLYLRQHVGNYNLLIHELIHVIGGPAVGEYHPPAPPSPMFKQCLPGFRYPA